jgi:hypothetical protein
MSRTDKDRPWWIRSEWYEPVHYNCMYYQGYQTCDRSRVCDLPPEPVRGNFSYPSAGHRYGPRAQCIWYPMWPRRVRYNYTRPPTRVDKHLGWWGPDRRDVRDLMIKARKQYRGYREVEILEPVRHHRHAGKAGWWD